MENKKEKDITINFGSATVLKLNLPLCAEDLARNFHRIYEELAPKFSYKTRKKTRTDWHKLPEPNKILMIAVAREILQLFQSEYQLIKCRHCGRYEKKLVLCNYCGRDIYE